MAPLEPVIVDEAGDEIVAQIGVEAGVILVGIAERLPHWRERVPCICAVDHAECDQRYARQQNLLHHLAPSCHYSAVLAQVLRVSLGTICILGAQKIEWTWCSAP